jgi:DNA-binding transcriptional regulator GbsR (MarR family)
MLGRLTKDNFVESIYHDDDYNERTDVVLESLVEDIQPFSDDVEKNNVGEVLFSLFKQSLDFVVNPELENDRKLAIAQTQSAKAKGVYGSGLLEDCKHSCSKPGCGKHLQVVDDKNHAVDDYQIACIKSGKTSSYDNLIAMCHDCFQRYVFKHTKAEEKELQTVKKIQSDARSTRYTLDEVAIEKGITKVIENLSKAKPSQIRTLNYDAVSVPEKIDEELHFFLVNEVTGHVTKYFLFIEKTMQDLVRQKQFSDDLLRAQIKESYRKLAEKKKSPEVIYSALSERLSSITKQDIRFCSIVVSYFIQSCEVFNAITK